MLDSTGEQPVNCVETLIDPRWRMFAINIDGRVLPVLRIEHPRHGNIDCVLPDETLTGMHHALCRIIADRGVTE